MKVHLRFRPTKMLGSIVCKQSDFESRWYSKWRKILDKSSYPLDDSCRNVWGKVWESMSSAKTMHRKVWEWSAIAQALDDRLMLRTSARGLGFAVGKEPLASLFASKGCQVVASDYNQSPDSNNWGSTGQLASSLESVHWPKLLPFSTFQQRVEFKNIDMNDLSDLPVGAFDFCWSSCSFEHLGSIEAGIAFLLQSMSSIKKGGIAVHTTEFNISSNTDTVTEGPSVIYRRADIEDLDFRLRMIGCALEGVDFCPGSLKHDLAYDFPPYYLNNRQHVKIWLDGYVSTSMLLVIRKWV